MFKTPHEAVVFAKEFRVAVKDVTGVEIVVAPPFTAVHAVAEALRNTNVGVAAQNLYWEREGAFTGEVSGPMIKDAGAEYVIIGHSERRRLFGDTDEGVNKKVFAALAAGLGPIVCVGETLDEREKNETFAVIDRQVREGLKGLTSAQVADLVVAYEPVWAIGTGLTATPEIAQLTCADIRGILAERFDAATAESCRIQYGGSANAENAASLVGQPDVDGLLVGGAALQAEAFTKICQAAAAVAS